MNHDQAALQPLTDRISVLVTLQALVKTHPDKGALDATLKAMTQNAVDTVFSSNVIPMEQQEDALAALERSMRPIYQALYK
jgi:citrate lyase gamma subunit